MKEVDLSSRRGQSATQIPLQDQGTHSSSCQKVWALLAYNSFTLQKMASAKRRFLSEVTCFPWCQPTSNGQSMCEHKYLDSTGTTVKGDFRTRFPKRISWRSPPPNPASLTFLEVLCPKTFLNKLLATNLRVSGSVSWGTQRIDFCFWALYSVPLVYLPLC